MSPLSDSFDNSTLVSEQNCLHDQWLHWRKRNFFFTLTKSDVHGNKTRFKDKIRIRNFSKHKTDARQTCKVQSAYSFQKRKDRAGNPGSQYQCVPLFPVYLESLSNSFPKYVTYFVPSPCCYYLSLII